MPVTVRSVRLKSTTRASEWDTQDEIISRLCTALFFVTADAIVGTKNVVQETQGSDT